MLGPGFLFSHHSLLIITIVILRQDLYVALNLRLSCLTLLSSWHYSCSLCTQAFSIMLKRDL